MSEKNAPSTAHSARPKSAEDSVRSLVELWFSLPPEKRDREFAGTRRAAKLAGVACRTMQDWVNLGRIPSVRIGGRYRIHLASMHDYLEHRSHPMENHPKRSSKRSRDKRA